jgi:hypothetical protein
VEQEQVVALQQEEILEQMEQMDKPVGVEVDTGIYQDHLPEVVQEAHASQEDQVVVPHIQPQVQQNLEVQMVEKEEQRLGVMQVEDQVIQEVLEQVEHPMVMQGTEERLL